MAFKRFWLISTIGTLVLTFIAYHKIIVNPLTPEDFEWIDKVAPLRMGDLYKIFLPPFLGGTEIMSWRLVPMAAFSFWVDYKFGGINPVFFHLTQLTIHLINVFLVYKLSVQILKNGRKILKNTVPFFAAMFFALFPYHSETVIWNGARPDIIATFFYLLSLISFISYLKRKNHGYLSLSLVTFTLALFSKESAVTLPFVIVALSLFLERKISPRAVFCFFVILLGWISLKFVSTTQGNGQLPCLLTCNGIFISGIFKIYLLISVFGIITISISKFRFLNRLAFHWGLFGLLFLPSAFLPTGVRYLYLPSVALALVFGEIIMIIFQKTGKLSVFLIISVIIIFESVFLTIRNERWTVAGAILENIISESKILTKGSDGYSTIYFLNIPNNFQKAYIYQGTGFETILRNADIKFNRTVIATSTDGVGQISAEIKGSRTIVLNSEPTFIVYKPEVTGQFANGDIVIDNRQTKILIEKNLHSAQIELKEDYIGKKNVYFLYFDGKSVRRI